MKCPRCQADNPATQPFCGACGAQIRGDVQDPTGPGARSRDAQDLQPEPTDTLHAPAQELATGSTFAGRYQVIEELGRGGMGRVYKVFDTDIREKIALKLLRPEIALDRDTVERFSNELKLARKIRHKNVCGMFDLGKAEGTAFITMEFVAGEDLKRFIRKSGQVGAGRAVSIARQVCEGLSEAHRLGVVHRDLKPQNIMVDDEGNARIMDFGIARSLRGRGATAAGTMIGTPEYMSPEQVEGKDADERSDIYSLGIILFEMLTGRVPFEGDTALSVAMKHKAEAPQDPRELNALIPEELGRLVLKCLEKEKEKRYQGVGEVLAALGAIETGTSMTGIAAAKSPDTKASDTEKILEREWKRSIAVLPFSNLSPEREQEYFCDGLSEEIINALSHVRELRVVARTSAFAFKGKEIDIREVGEKLNVDAVLEGSVRKAGDRLRITAQLVNVADGYHLWSERFDRALKDVFDIQDEVTLEIVAKLRIELLGKERGQVVKRYTDSLEAHNLLLKGRYFWAKRTPEALKKGLECVRQALEIDPAYGLAHSHLASLFNSLGYYGFMRPHEAFREAKAAARKALEIDGSLPQAHSALAWISLLYDWDWAAAEKGFKKALSLNPGLDYAHYGYAAFLECRGRLDEALQAFKKVLELDPLSILMNTELGSCLRLARRYDEAREQLRKTIEMDPGFGLAHFYMGMVYANEGMYQEAVPEFQKAIDLTGGLSWAYGWLGCAYAMLGRKDEAEKIVLKLAERAKEEYIRPTTFSSMYWALGDKDKWFESIEKAIEERDPIMPFFKVLPETDEFRQDPRFNALLEKLNL